MKVAKFYKINKSEQSKKKK